MNSEGSELERLRAAQGSSPGIPEVTFREFVEHVAETLDAGPGTRVFDVACGAGALLYPLAQNGYIVGGLDSSPALIDLARDAMPGGRWQVGDPAALDPGEAWDVVLSLRAFRRFRTLDQARGVLARMAAKATHAVAVLDVPEGPGPPGDGTHDGALVYERSWFLRALTEIGVTAVQFENIVLGDEPDAPRRFHVFARI